MKHYVRYIRWSGRKNQGYRREEWKHLSRYFEKYSDEIYDAVMGFHFQRYAGDPQLFKEKLRNLCRKKGGIEEAEGIFRTYYSHKEFAKEKTLKFLEDAENIFKGEKPKGKRELSAEEWDTLYSIVREIRGSGCGMLGAIEIYTSLFMHAEILSDLQGKMWTLEGRHAMHDLTVSAVRKIYHCYAESLDATPKITAETAIYNQLCSLLEKRMKMKRWLNYSTDNF